MRTIGAGVLGVGRCFAAAVEIFDVSWDIWEGVVVTGPEWVGWCIQSGNRGRI